MLKILRQHHIDVYRLGSNFTQEGITFEPDWAYVVPANQPGYRLIRGIFDKATTFEDSLFYDISAWSLPLAFNMPHAEVRTNVSAGPKLDTVPFPAGKVTGDAGAYAYAFRWNDYYAPRAVHALLAKGYNLKVATEPFTMTVDGQTRQFDYGTILLHGSIQSRSPQEIHRELQALAARDGIDVYALDTGLSPSGIDFGSSNFATLSRPRVLLLVGTGVRSNDAGEVWHLLDQRYNMPPTLVEMNNFGRVNLGKYNVLVMVGGNYGGLSKADTDKIRNWVQNGGTCIAMTEAVRWAAVQGFANVTFKSAPRDTSQQQPYASLDRYRGAQEIGGAIFQARLDRTHPLGYGYTNDLISVFRDNTIFMERPKNSFTAPLVYTDKPLLSGYISAPNLQQLRNTAAIAVNPLGRGKVVLMTDNPNFRAFWHGTNKLFMNAIFFAPVISSATGTVDE
jgi:hypothetical protein